MTLWVDAVMCMDTQLVSAENSMKARGMSAILSQLLTKKLGFKPRPYRTALIVLYLLLLRCTIS